jgi:CotH kinase protein/Secretion system C-terminal sorting domain/Chitobiase/beta-hexosaminidase C-terminal domain/Divergent InlB B-repeat domain
MRLLPSIILCITFCLLLNVANSQVYINEGSNRNYTAIADENGDYPDWIELYNAGSDTVNLLNYSLTDNISNPAKWTFSNIVMLPGEYRIVFCSGKDRKPITGFTSVLYEQNYSPVVGWNTHTLTTPFYWDGVSSLLLNSCSYSSTGYTTNSQFNQTATPYNSTLVAFQDGGPAICGSEYGTQFTQRPNLKINNFTIGTGTIVNSPYDYPAPYGNWYWAAKNQLIIPGTELSAAGLSAGLITDFAFDVVATDTNTVYDYIDYSMRLVAYSAVSSTFELVDTNMRLHTNFKIKTSGETIYLFDSTQTLVNSLFVNCEQPDNSTGRSPDASTTVVLFLTGTPEATNNSSQAFYTYLAPPVISLPSGIYNSVISVGITNPNGAGTSIRYTLDGSDPDTSSALYPGTPIPVFYSSVLKARVFSANELPSLTATSSYLFGISHVTPILSIVTAPQNLYGASGIFDNWQFDWEKAAYVEYFDTTQQIIFSQRAGIQIDGGLGGSRSQPQHSMRVELDHSVLGDGTINYPLIPNRSTRTTYSKFYLRNGSNYFLTLPYKDAAHVEGMGAETNNYYTAWRPVTVYINGAYFGLYELREKIDAEYFEENDGADKDSLDILSLSAWRGYVLRDLEGSVDTFYTDYANFTNLNTADTGYWNAADQYFDLVYYTDYVIGETYSGNIDWPQNNIKLYRSNSTNFRWRFCLIDLEGGMDPIGFSSAYDDHISYILTADASNPYINVFLRSVENPRYKNYFINRYADLMNTSYQYSRLSSVANDMFNQTVIEMPNQYMRWGDPNDVNGQMNDFVTYHQTFLSELAVRTTVVRDDIESNFSLNGQVDVTLDVFPAGAGQIKISTIIPDSLPWTGVYFDGNPVRLTAIPNPGYTFAYWDANAVLNAIDTNRSIELNIDASTLFQAFFTPTPIGIAPVNATDENFSIYPNPSKGEFKILLPTDNADIVVTNMLGQQLISTRATQRSVDLQLSENGVYIVYVTTAQGTTARKLIIDSGKN